MVRSHFENDVEACKRAQDRARLLGTLGCLFTFGIWTNRSGVEAADARFKSAEEDLAKLGVLSGEIVQLRSRLDRFVVENGVRVAECAFPDVTIEGKQTYGPFWETIRKAVLDRDSYCCQHADAFCDGPLQIHHKRPLSVGGTNDLHNLITLCRYHHGLQHPDNPVFKR